MNLTSAGVADERGKKHRVRLAAEGIETPAAKRPDQQKPPPEQQAKRRRVDAGPQPEPNPRTQPLDPSLNPAPNPLQVHPITAQYTHSQPSFQSQPQPQPRLQSQLQPQPQLDTALALHHTQPRPQPFRNSPAPRVYFVTYTSVRQQVADEGVRSALSPEGASSPSGAPGTTDTGGGQGGQRPGYVPACCNVPRTNVRGFNSRRRRYARGFCRRRDREGEGYGGKRPGRKGKGKRTSGEPGVWWLYCRSTEKGWKQWADGQ